MPKELNYHRIAHCCGLARLRIPLIVNSLRDLVDSDFFWLILQISKYGQRVQLDIVFGSEHFSLLAIDISLRSAHSPSSHFDDLCC